jgi:hypothetical protein
MGIGSEVVFVAPWPRSVAIVTSLGRIQVTLKPLRSTLWPRTVDV